MTTSEPPVLRVVALGSADAEVPDVPPWPQGRVRPVVEIWLGATKTGQESEPGSRDWVAAAHAVAKPDPFAVWRSFRGPGARVRASMIARRCRLSGPWLWTLKRDRALARALRAADFILALDDDTYDVLANVPELARGATLLRMNAREPLWPWLAGWEALILELESVLESKRMQRGWDFPEGRDRVPPRGGGEPSEATRAAWSRDLVRRTEMIASSVRAAMSVAESCVMLTRGLEPYMAAAGVPGRLRAVIAAQNLWMDQAAHSEAEVAAIVRDEVGRADEAWGADDRDLALVRLHAAMRLSMHRVLHTEDVRSALLEDPGSWLASIRTCRTYEALIAPSAPVPQFELPKRGITSKPIVVILPAAYGAYHYDLVASLRDHAEVRVPSLPGRHASLRRRLPAAQDLQLIDAMNRGEVDIDARRWGDEEIGEGSMGGQFEALQALRSAILGADVVVAEWFGAGTMWASRLLPAETKMVVRGHSLDFYDPWLHLMDWNSVNQVIVPHAGYASLFADLTVGTDAPQPNIMGPYRPDLPHWSRGRDPKVRFTLGMVGWGRRVKDPMMALDLLDLDERRSLVLIGQGFGTKLTGAHLAYAQAFAARAAEPRYAGRIDFVGHSDDVADRLAGVGVVLSCSMREGWHLGVIEGAASGAVPVVREWPLLASRGGASHMFPPGWVVPDVVAADARIAALADPQAWLDASQSATAAALEWFDAERTAERYRKLLLPGPRVGVPAAHL